VIQAAAWFCAEDCGVFVPHGVSLWQPSPRDSQSLVTKPVKYYSRMTEEARFCLGAGSLALNGAGWNSGAMEIGSLAAGAQGFVHANEEYFRDYVANGRSLGRGNLFIYTLPTSALGETSIALGLTGPCLFLQADSEPMEAMVRRAQRLCADGEAGGMLVFWSDRQTTICYAVDSGEEEFPPLPGEWGPAELRDKLRSMVQQA
jgi:hypothetical protein